MGHPNHTIHRVVAFEITGPHVLRVKFDDGFEHDIDFGPVLAGEIFGPLLDEELFNQVKIDPETHTLVWPNGADFDPETLRYWSKYVDAMKRMAKRWAAAESKAL